MAKIVANGIEKEIDLIVFDKDGLMFQSQGFWKELGNKRISYLRKYFDDKTIREWARVYGLTLDENGLVTYTDPKGILAVAAPNEEVIITAALMVQHNYIPWETAFAQAKEVFSLADANFELARALVPQKGFPDIFTRLRSAGVKVAIATSDTTKRAKESLKLFGVEPPEIIVVSDMVKHGKPEPDMLLLAAKLCDTPIEKTAMLGDSYVDVKMAFEAGAFGIGIPETDFMKNEMKPYTKAILNNLDEIEIQ